MIAYTLNSLVNVQGASISNLWQEIHKQVVAGNSTFLWFLCLTTNAIASFISCVFCSIKCNLVICYICNTSDFKYGRYMYIHEPSIHMQGMAYVCLWKAYLFLAQIWHVVAIRCDLTYT